METNYVIANSMKMQRHVKNKSNYMHTECIRYISKGFYLDLRRVLAFLFLTLAIFLYLNFDMCLQNETISSRLFRSDVGSAFRMLSFSPAKNQTFGYQISFYPAALSMVPAF